jgi:putative peptidoglycan lipid II flippase
MSLLRSIVTVGSLTMASRVLGFVRDVLVAAVLGAGPTADVFFVAFKLPNLFRRLFAEGAFAVAFVPIFSGELEENGLAEARAFAEESLAVLLWALLGLVIVFELAMPWIMHAVAPGFVGDARRFPLAVALTRITFPYLLFISLVSLFGGVLNSLGRFAAAAATPILLNLCLIGAVLVAVRWTASPAPALAWGVFAAGIAQLTWIYVHAARLGMGLRLRRPRLSKRVRTLLRRILPVALGAGVYQVNLLIDTVIASLLPAGSISYLFFADRVTQLPLGVVGVAVGTALLPVLSRQVRSGNGDRALASQNRALEFSLLLTLPAAAALYLISGPIVAVLFQRGAFDMAQVQATAAAVAVYALGLPAYVLVKALAPGFFAREDTKTPVKISIAAMLANIFLSLLLMGPFKHVGIAAATAAAAWLNAGLMAWVLKNRGHLAPDGRLKARLAKTLLATAAMAGVLVFGQWWLNGAVSWQVSASGEAGRIGALAALIGAGLVTFGVAAQITGAARLADLKAHLRRPPAP